MIFLSPYLTLCFFWARTLRLFFVRALLRSCSSPFSWHAVAAAASCGDMVKRSRARMQSDWELMVSENEDVVGFNDDHVDSVLNCLVCKQRIPRVWTEGEGTTF